MEYSMKQLADFADNNGSMYDSMLDAIGTGDNDGIELGALLGMIKESPVGDRMTVTLSEKNLGIEKSGRVIQAYVKTGNEMKVPFDIGTWTPQHIGRMLLNKLDGTEYKVGRNESYDTGLISGIIVTEADRSTLQELADSRVDRQEDYQGKLKEFLRGNGIDSIRYTNSIEGNGEESIMVLDSSSVKSADPVTYDDAGNVIPLEERFNAGNEDISYSIQNTKTMPWNTQITGALNRKKGTIKRSDTLVVSNSVKSYLVNDGISNKPLAIPLRVISKSIDRRNNDHAIDENNLRKLKNGIKDPIATIVNPERNSICYVTSLKQDSGNVLAFFDADSIIDGEPVHSATSIHTRDNISGMLDKLPSNATIYLNSEKINEFNQLARRSDSIPDAYTSMIKLINENVTHSFSDVNENSDGTLFSLKDNPNAQVGINISNEEPGIIEKIMSGEKTVETRDTPSLRSYVGQTVGIVDTHDRKYNGKATVVGYAKIVDEIHYDSEEAFRDDYERHQIGRDSNYYYTKSKTGEKYGYVLEWVKDEPNPYQVTERGIVARDIDPGVQKNDVRYSSIYAPESLKEIKEKYRDQAKYLFMSEHGSNITLHNVVVNDGMRNNGVGTSIMTDLIHYADSNGKTIQLTPTSEFGTKAKLTKWYKKFGFVENKGKNTDFRISETMYRQPHEIRDDNWFQRTSAGMGDPITTGEAYVDKNGTLHTRYSQAETTEAVEPRATSTDRKLAAAQKARDHLYDALAQYKAAAKAKYSADMAAYEGDLRALKKKYDADTRALMKQYSTDTEIMEREFNRVVKAMAKQGKTDAAEIGKQLRLEAQKHRQDSKTWEREFNRLLTQYERADRNLEKMTAKLAEEKQKAKDKVESRKRTEAKNKLRKAVDELNHILLHPTKTAYVPTNMQASVAALLDAINMENTDYAGLEAKYQESLKIDLSTRNGILNYEY